MYQLAAFADKGTPQFAGFEKSEHFVSEVSSETPFSWLRSEVNVIAEWRITP